MLTRDMSREHLRDIQAVLDDRVNFLRLLLVVLVLIVAGSLALDSSCAQCLRRGSCCLAYVSKEAEDGHTIAYTHAMAQRQTLSRTRRQTLSWTRRQTLSWTSYTPCTSQKEDK